jgi:hypothetical protein
MLELQAAASARARRYSMTATIFAHHTAGSASDLDAELQNLFDWIEDDEDDDPFIYSGSISLCCIY